MRLTFLNLETLFNILYFALFLRYFLFRSLYFVSYFLSFVSYFFTFYFLFFAFGTPVTRFAYLYTII
jgi:hypothetical protein